MPDRPYPLNGAHDDVELMMRAGWPQAVIEKTDPSRAYSGQEHTHLGERGKTAIRAVTLRDIADCFQLGHFMASGLPTDKWPDDIHDLPDLDPGAVIQNAVCEIERRMGIFPNLEVPNPYAYGDS